MRKQVILWKPETDDEWEEAGLAVMKCHNSAAQLKSSMGFFRNDAISAIEGKAEQCMVDWYPEHRFVNMEQFMDALNDRLKPWRLEAVGYVKAEDGGECWESPEYVGCRVCVGFFEDGSVSVNLHVDYASIPLEIDKLKDLEAFTGCFKKLD